MTNKNQTENPPKKETDIDGNTEGYPLYPPSEDIYKNSHQETEIDPDEYTKEEMPNIRPGTPDGKGHSGDRSGNELDIPGSELDDELEDIGSEDEENNYYSIGGDNHDDLEDDNG